ncbi:MAG TPA: hypothetical protein VFM15_00870, partial [Gammaproteobacteria bacterium]|nr:hypothetical protein [Gammaproteobacteria bacterium]
MSRSESVLYRTGQAWKFWVLPIGTLLCFAILIGVERFKEALPGIWFITVMFFIVMVQISCIAFPLIAIKCPHCGAQWLWRAFSREASKNWLDKIMLS